MTPLYIVWNFDPELISSPIAIRWYGVMFAIGFLLGYEIVTRMFRHEGGGENWSGILLLYVMVGTIVGARLGHVFFYEWGYYSEHLSEIPKVWHGGLSSHGGAIGIIIGVFCFSWFTTKKSPLWTFDRLVVAVAVVGALIRLGNLFNSEIFGGPTTLPWGVMFVRSREWHECFFGQACHPTQIYESLCYLATFGLLMWMYWKRDAQTRPGLLFGVALVCIFVSRFFIEFIKNDQVDFEASMTLNMGQCLSIPFVLIGIFFVWRALHRDKCHIDFPNRFYDEAPRK